MKTAIRILAIATSLLPISAFAAKPKHATPKVTAYECTVCHMKLTPAQAKKNHYKDPMDGGKLVPVSRAGAPSLRVPTAKKPMHPSPSMGGMKM